MKAQDLRIGNLVNVLGETRVVKSIDRFGISYDNSQELERLMTFNADKIKPIPLTEEWLVKLGFEKKNIYGKHNKFFYIRNKLYFCEYDFYSFVYSNNSLEIKEPKYVHQLQNLYFVLTGEELTINN